MSDRTWTRREFVQAAFTVAGAEAVARHGFAQATPMGDFAFVGSASPEQPEDGTIHVFRTGRRWAERSTVPAPAPAHLVMHPTLPVLYAVHNVETWDHLPRGAVSAYRFDRETARLKLLTTQPLSLSATFPRHAVLTAGATYLFVAAEGGGIYNLLPVANDGCLLTVSAIRKEFGLEADGIAKPAAPNSVALLPDGSLLAADAGQETLTNFLVEGGALTPRHRTRVHRGEGPAHLTLSPDGQFAYTAGAALGAVRRHRLVNGKAVEETELYQVSQSAVASAVPHVHHVLSLLRV